jgi:hypothetical protein
MYITINQFSEGRHEKELDDIVFLHSCFNFVYLLPYLCANKREWTAACKRGKELDQCAVSKQKKVLVAKAKNIE